MRAIKIAAVAGLSLFAVACASSGSDEATIAQAPLPPSPLAPPPPPPPPPPPASRAVAGALRAAPSDSPIIVTGSHAAPAQEVAVNRLPQFEPNQSRYAYIPPIQVATDPGNERYAGE